LPSDLTPEQQREADRWSEWLRHLEAAEGFRMILNQSQYAEVVRLGLDPSVVDVAERLEF
jgi:hypothetical protein